MISFAAFIILKVFIAVVGILSLIRLANHYHRYTFFYQYLFFCRFPLLFSVLLLVLPFLVVGPAASLLGNLVELDPWDIVSAAFTIVFTSWIILFNLTRTLEITPHKTELPYIRENYSCSGQSGTNALKDQSFFLRVLCHLGQVVMGEEIYPIRRLVYFALLALPFLLVVIYASSTIDGKLRGMLILWNSLSAVAGVLLAVLARWMVAALDRRYNDPQKIRTWHTSRVARPFIQAAEFILHRFFGLEAPVPEAVRVNFAKGVIFAVISLLIYGLAGVLTLPELSEWAHGLIPSIVPALMLVWLYCFGLSLLAVALDTRRVPVLTFAFICVVLLYYTLETDYTYEMRPSGQNTDVQARTADTEGVDAAITPADALTAWRRGRGTGSKVMVVVAASGGGITAAQWTAEVLTRLHEGLFPDFGRSLVLLSTTSGGSTGAMYYTDRFPGLISDLSNPEVYNAIRSAADRSSLNAAVHGLVYGDVWRFIPGVHVLLRDRGNALEDVWKQRLAHPDASILDWGRDVAKGDRPAHIFNATIAETGELFLISPLRHKDRYDHFQKLYPGKDLGVATAARLSATFPFVSPQARPSRFQVADSSAFHLADGGYFDNQGLLGAITFVDEAFQGLAGSSDETISLPEYVLLIQIRAFEKETPSAEPEKGWKYAFFGPVVTVMNMRSAAQETRGSLEVEFFKRLQKAKQKVTVKTVSFALGRDEAPLSWHLTQSNRSDIRCAWNQQREGYNKVRGILNGGSEFTEVEGCPELSE